MGCPLSIGVFQSDIDRTQDLDCAGAMKDRTASAAAKAAIGSAHDPLRG